MLPHLARVSLGPIEVPGRRAREDAALGSTVAARRRAHVLYAAVSLQRRLLTKSGHPSPKPRSTLASQRNGASEDSALMFAAEVVV
ncbi:hypothetical protein HPB50_004615 [Hyalomma asiaticum]|uniref:Uncharacterized protein n=1 Tax=Hyalomma asiaticum TaxID=266040 RepID=A0ACB7SKP0_HYAAI|nr:hypothetical protein HPB50_004615 [Hyalomma asiaticum]